MMCELATTATCHLFSRSRLRDLELGAGKGGVYRCKGLPIGRGRVRVYRVRDGLDHTNAAFLNEGLRARGCR